MLPSALQELGPDYVRSDIPEPDENDESQPD